MAPVIVTEVPKAPVVGVNEEIVGAGTNVNPAREPVPYGVLTVTLPDAPLIPTFTVIVVEFTTVKPVPGIPPKLTEVASVKSLPVIVTVIPGPAEVGVKEATTGGAT